MNPLFNTPLTSLADCEGFFFCLDQQGLMFHPEDDPATVITDQGRLFTDAEVIALRRRIDEVYEFMDDPCEFILSMTESDFRR